MVLGVSIKAKHLVLHLLNHADHSHTHILTICSAKPPPRPTYFLLVRDWTRNPPVLVPQESNRWSGSVLTTWIKCFHMTTPVISDVCFSISDQGSKRKKLQDISVWTTCSRPRTWRRLKLNNWICQLTHLQFIFWEKTDIQYPKYKHNKSCSPSCAMTIKIWIFWDFSCSKLTLALGWDCAPFCRLLLGQTRFRISTCNSLNVGKIMFWRIK